MQFKKSKVLEELHSWIDNSSQLQKQESRGGFLVASKLIEKHLKSLEVTFQYAINTRILFKSDLGNMLKPNEIEKMQVDYYTFAKTIEKKIFKQILQKWS